MGVLVEVGMDVAELATLASRALAWTAVAASGAHATGRLGTTGSVVRSGALTVVTRLGKVGVEGRIARPGGDVPADVLASGDATGEAADLRALVPDELVTRQWRDGGFHMAI